ncbi:MAG TPA: LysR family transcriptional regulator [Clostridia bacterium]|nr:LysR family transcriptional regulator [Clostridia bacterium]
MKLEQIEQVVEVAKTKSISQAAANMYISQPNLSLSIKNLEKEIGHQIFARTGKGIEITAFGREFISYAQTILLQLYQLRNMSLDDTKNTLSFSIANMHYRYVNHAIGTLFQNHQSDNIRMEVFEGGRDSVINAVYEKNCEIGIVGMFSHYHKIALKQFDSKDIQYYRLSSNPITIAVGKMNPLFYKDSNYVTTDLLDQYPLVVLNELDCGPYVSVLEGLGLQRLKTRIVVSERATVYDLLEKTNCFTITTTNQMAYKNTDYYPDIRSLILEDSQICGEIGWIKRKDHLPSKLTLEFLQILSGYYTILN